MNITLAELQVLLDSTMGTLSIVDRLNLFNYSVDTRQTVINKVLKKMQNVTLTIENKQDKND